MIEFRRMRLSEVDAVAALGCEALRVHAADVPLNMSPIKVRAVVNNFCVHREHFHEVAFDNGEPVGAVALYVSEMPFHERCDGHVMMAYARVPGTGLRLISSMMRWVHKDIRIQRVLWMMNHDAGRFASLISRRWNFQHRVDNLTYYKGG